MLKTIANAFSVADIRKKLAFTAAMLLLYRLGAYIPAPGVDADAVKEIQSNFGGGNILGFLNLFSGGGLSRLSLFALGIMPYITASIILQLLTVVVPSLEKLQKEGEVGQQKITQYTRYLTVGLAFGQSFGYVYLFRSFGQTRRQRRRRPAERRPRPADRRLPDRGLHAADVARRADHPARHRQRHLADDLRLDRLAHPQGIESWWTNPDQVFVVMMPFVALAVILAIVFVQEGQRRIPVQYAKRVVGRRMTSGGSTYLPLRVNMAGVIPVIFAASIMAFPPTIGQLLNTPAALDFAAFFSPNGWAYVVGEVFFIIIFTYFYTAVTFNPVDQADNLKKYGGFIPGVRPGRPTAEYLDRILSRLTFPGALYLGAVAALPTILISQTSANFFFGGTSILIVVGVALDTVKQLEAQLMMRNYEGFLKYELEPRPSRAAGQRQGHPGRAAAGRPPASLLRDRRHPARRGARGDRARQDREGVHGPRRPRPRRGDRRRDRRADRLRPRPPTASSSTASRAPCPRPRRSRRSSASSAAASPASS